MRKLSTEEFVRQAVKIHGIRYSYALVEYRSSREKVRIVCSQHGEFEVAPGQHLAGKGCRSCGLGAGGSKRAEAAGTRFFKRAAEIHVGKGYSYPDSYVAAKVKMQIGCSTHGLFWQTPDAHARGAGCPVCEAENKPERNKLRGAKEGARFEEKARIMHGDRYDYREAAYVRATTPVMIICKEHGGFSQTPQSHLSGRGCPQCGMEATQLVNLARSEAAGAGFVAKAIEVHGLEYDYSKATYAGSNMPVEIGCSKHGYFAQLPQPHLQGHGCPVCGVEKKGKEPLSFSEFASRANAAHGDRYQYDEASYEKLSGKVAITCALHGLFTQQASSHVQGCGCPTCGKGMTGAEDSLVEYVESLGIDVTRNNRALIPPKELDLVCSDKKVAIEHCGLYWHRSSNPTTTENTGPVKPVNYHLDKTLACSAAGYRLLTIFGDEWQERRAQAKTLLARTLVPETLNRVGARKCSIEALTSSEAKAFLDAAHLSGFSASRHYLGLNLGGDLMAVAALSPPRAIFGSEPVEGRLELVRFSVRPGWLVHGALRRLCLGAFSLVPDTHEILSYVDRRWFTGSGYLSAGFSLLGASAPGFWYAKGASRFSRYTFAKHKLDKLLVVFDPEKTGQENMADNGYFTVHDCGQLKMLLRR